MPAQSFRSTLGTGAPAAAPAPAVPLNGHYPKTLQGDSGSVWLVTKPKTGVILYLSPRPQKAKHKLGYTSEKLNESKMRPYNGPITIQTSA